MSHQKLTPSQELADELYPPTDIGPIWKTDERGVWLLPEYTLGWEAAAWAEVNLNAIRGTGKLELTDEQWRVILWTYEIDEDGDFKNPNAVYQAFKGAGKDPFAAVVCLIELVGPCRFSHWDKNGDPVAKENEDAWVQLLAVNKEQNQNTMNMFPKIISKQLISDHGMDVQKEIIYAHNGRRQLRMSGAAARSSEGNRVTFVLCNETQHWTPTNGGVNLFETVSDNVGKTHNARLMCITNAFAPGEDSVAERIRNQQEKVWAGLAAKSGWLYMSREAHPKAPLDPAWVPFIMERIIGDAWWQRANIKSLISRVLDGSRPASRIRRMYYNQVTSSESAFFTKDEIDNSLIEDCYGDERDLNPGDEIVLGFDGSKTNDTTALVAIRIKDRLIVPIEIQQRPAEAIDWQVDVQAVDEAVGRCFSAYQVKAFFADVALWESYITRWGELYGEHLEVSGPHSKIGYDMRGSKEKVSLAWEAFRQAVRDATLRHNGNGFWRIHALNAHMGHNGRGLIARKAKADSPHKIDVMVASFVAYTALTTWLEKGKKKPNYRRKLMRSSQRAAY